MSDLDNTRSAPVRPNLDKLRAGVGAHQAAAYIEYLESLPCQQFTPDDLRFVRRILRATAADPGSYPGYRADKEMAQTVLRHIGH